MILNRYFSDVKNLDGRAMSVCLPYDEIEFDRNVKLEVKMNFPHDGDFGYFVRVDFHYTGKTKEKTTKFPHCP